MKTKVLIYNSLIVSHPNFCILAWGYQCDRVIKLQKKVIWILNLSKYNAHTEPIFKELKLLKVKDILKLQELKFYFKYKNRKSIVIMERFNVYQIQHVRMFTGILWLKEGGYQNVVKNGQKTPNFKKAENIWPNIFKLSFNTTREPK